ncbi:MAG: phenylacetate--CoA ligase [Lentisphaeria bacterium]|nr:phenylacetate--CoA ligase [Lentisphaeria bacterium]
MPAPLVPNVIFDPAETLPRPDLEALQLARLRRTVDHVRRAPFFQRELAARGLTGDSLRSLDDVRRLPFTVKENLRAHYPLDLLAVPREDLARIHGSSGTTGTPTFVAYTAKDLDTWSGLCARFLRAGGLSPAHTVQISFGYGLFTGGFGLHYGAEMVGAAILPAAAGNTDRQIQLLKDIGADALVCTPSYALTIAETMKKQGVSPGDLNLSLGFFGAEPWTEDMRVEIEKELGILAFNNYGLSEVIGPGVSGECPYRDGMHVQEDNFIIECLDPETLEPVPDGELGELVITTINKEAMPFLRYRTRDIARLNHEPCPCGRTGVRMSRVTGRSDDMLIIRGVNIFPSQIEEALLRIEGVAPHYQIIVDRPGYLDELTVRVEIRPDSFSDEMRVMQQLRDRIARRVQTVTGVRCAIELAPPETLARFEGKAKRVVDRRLSKGGL